ncbi:MULTISPECIES: hypothetical protein [Chroococcidiopsis]|nr:MULTISPECIES: hypothetical protein [Chroococcidiopsis]MDZ4874847.1 hypothetical protein [Chroococcidiopsis cubana SAG 39.79]PSB49864.1 hypothetical protein C7B80_00375 [Cyanosarcina cf. burmensis CCALA 770]RUT08077.1 hypothetical protein DSM107010_48710 [Chroococcidiopsis cubana SAG 39.79]URD52524.1 hypothetical protein M5J74_11115 [Chroococcidiopsis sp. CCNUC1]
MEKIHPRRKWTQIMALVLTALLTLPILNACGGSPNTSAPPPPVADNVGRTQTYPSNQPQARKGLSTGQKIAILGGAAALYYIYNQHKNRKGQGPQGQYYLSKNGRIYYRDAQGRPHWVTPPPEGIRVPESEARQYRDFQGYNNRSTGRDLTDLQPAPAL